MFSDDVVYEEYTCVCVSADDKLVLGKHYTYILNYHVKAGYNVIRVIVDGKVTTFYKDVFEKHFITLEEFRTQQLGRLI